MFSDTYGGENRSQNVPTVILYAVQRPHKNFNNIRIIERRRGRPTVSKFSKSGRRFYAHAGLYEMRTPLRGT